VRALVRSADVVNVQDALYATSLATLAIARRQGVASVLTQHVSFVPQDSRWLDVVQRGAIATIGRGARLATLVVTYNPAVAQWVEETWGIPRPQVLPAGVVVAGADDDRATVRSSFGLPPDRFIALFIGRDVPKKGLDILLAAADPAYEIVAVTDRLTSPGGVTMLPFMDAGRVQALLRCVDAFVLPSEAEGFPLTLQEAFTAGVPVVTTMQPGYEHYETGDDVLIVERDPSSVRDALLRLVESEDLRCELSNRSLAVAERHFGVEQFVSAYEGAYEEAIRRRSRQS
jgi:glycosyltransferase involved in cell wall biosynthesis